MVEPPCFRSKAKKGSGRVVAVAVVAAQALAIWRSNPARSTVAGAGLGLS